MFIATTTLVLWVLSHVQRDCWKWLSSVAFEEIILMLRARCWGISVSIWAEKCFRACNSYICSFGGKRGIR